MIFFVADDGAIISFAPSSVYQGDANLNNVYLAAPFDEKLQASVSFNLSNGTCFERRSMVAVQKLNGIVSGKSGEKYNGWQFALPEEIKQYIGTVTVKFFFYSEQSGISTPTGSTSFTVERGEGAASPSVPGTDICDAVMTMLTEMSKQLENGLYPSRSVKVWNSACTYESGEITYYSDKGEFGAFVRSKFANLNTPPFNSEGVLNAQYWEILLDFNRQTTAVVLWGFNQAVDISELEWEVK